MHGHNVSKWHAGTVDTL